MWAVVLAFAVSQEPVDPFAKWEKAIAAFEALDAALPPPKNAVLFAGASSIVNWKLPVFFPDLVAINRGFGGSQVRDSTHFVDRVVTKHDPRIVVFYAGDNDINAGRKPEQVGDDFKAFAASVWAKCPKTRIVFICIKPSIARWKQRETQIKANALVEAFCKTDDRLRYLDIATPMLGPDGTPVPELFVKDGLHLSDKGYRIWSDLLSPLLK